MKNELLGDYEILRLLGEGSNGLVYHVRHRKTNQEFAAKEFPGTGEAAQRFFRELSILFSLRHPNIIRCVNLIYAGGRTNFLMLEYAPEGSLKNLLEEKPEGLNPSAVLLLARQMASALALAHDTHIVHCDIKPDNILLDRSLNGDLLFKLADLGIAFKILRDEVQRSRGTPVYMAPEQFFDNPVPASDFYSLGVVLYECLTGKPPFEGSAEQLFVAHQQAEPAYDGIASPLWRSLLQRLMQKDAASRPPSAQDLLCELEMFDSPSPASRALPTVSTGAGRPGKILIPASRPEMTMHAPGSQHIFSLSDSGDLFTADANSIDAYDVGMRKVRRQVRVGQFACSAVARNSGAVILIVSSRLWHRRSPQEAFRILHPERIEASAAAARPDGESFVVADSQRVTCLGPAGESRWSVPCANYFLKPVLLLLADGRVLVGSGPSTPCVNVFSSSGDRIARFPLPGPLLALGPSSGNGNDALALVQGLSATDPAKIVAIAPTGTRVVAELNAGVFAAAWHDGFFTAFTSGRTVLFVSPQGTILSNLPLPGDALGDARVAGFYGILLRSGGPAVLQIHRLITPVPAEESAILAQIPIIS